MGTRDKVGDQVYDAGLDAMLTVDPKARVACETMVTTGMVVVAGEVTCDGYVDINRVVRKTVTQIGYDNGEMGFDGHSCAVLVSLDEQSRDIAQGVDEDAATGKAQGAGDQGMMFGFACKETPTPTLMPLPIYLAHRLMARHAEIRRSGAIAHLRPDAKSQVSIAYDNHRPVRVDTIVLSTQHGPQWNDRQDELERQVKEHILKPVLGEWWHDDLTIHVNTAGHYQTRGPTGDVSQQQPGDRGRQ